jgi:hypothetical protein
LARRRGRRHDRSPAEDETPVLAPADDRVTCWLCARPLGRRREWHHVVPKSRGGRTTVPVHPICHRTLHACFSNAELARIGREDLPIAAEPAIQTFLAWIADKPPDFHAPTRRRTREP